MIEYSKINCGSQPTCCTVLNWPGQKTTEACDWVIGTHISDKWRPYAFGLIDIFVCYSKNKLKCLYINIFIFSFELLTTVKVVIQAELAVALWGYACCPPDNGRSSRSFPPEFFIFFD